MSRLALLLTAAVALAGLLAWLARPAPRSGAPAAVERMATSPRRATDPPENEAPLAGATRRGGRSALDPSKVVHDAAAEAAGDCALEGVVLLPDGFPKPREVEIQAWSGPRSRAPLPASTLAASDGTWRFEDLASGAKTLVATATAKGRSGWGKTRLVLSEGGETPFVRLALAEYAVRGRLVDSNGDPIRGVRVEVDWKRRDPHAGPAVHRIDLLGGSFEESPRKEALQALIDGLADEVGQKRAVAVDTRDLLFEGESKIEQVVSITAPVRLSPDPSVLMELGRSVEIRESWKLRGSKKFFAMSNASGRFRLGLPGPGTVHAYAPSNRSKSGPAVGPAVGPAAGPAIDLGETRWRRDDVHTEVATEAPVADVELRLLPSASLEVRLALASEAENAVVRVSLHHVESGTTTSSALSTASSEHGFWFQFRSLKPGEIRVTASTDGENRLAYRGVVAVETGRANVLTGTLTAASELSGAIVSAGGVPLQNALLTLGDAAVRGATRRVQADALGRFSVSGLHAGEYTIEVDGCTVVRGGKVSVASGGHRAYASVVVACSR